MSAHEHLNDDVLIDGLYGLIDVEERIGACLPCASRWSELQEKHAALAVPMEVAPEVLAAQRRNIYARIEHPFKSAPLRWAAPVMAAVAVCVLAIGVVAHHPVTDVHPAPAPASETQQLSDVYSDVYSMEQSFEPTASASLRALFEADGSQASESGSQSTKQ
jgi:hypothetical protein